MEIKWRKFVYEKNKSPQIELSPPYFLKVAAHKGNTTGRAIPSKIVSVGDVNELLGVCDDCTEFDWKSVTEYGEILGLEIPCLNAT